MKYRFLLITLDFPPRTGGVARYYDGLCSALPEHEIAVLAPTISGDHGSDRKNIFRRHLVFSWIWPQWLPLLFHAFWTIRRLQPKEVWVGQVLPVGIVVWLLRRFQISDFKFQIFTHGMDVLMPQQSRWKTWLVRTILRAADRVVANSNFTKQEVVKLGVSAEKVVVVYPCPTIADLRFSAKGGSASGGKISDFGLRERYHLEDKKILLTVARLVKRKGIDCVFEALRTLSEAKLRTIGDLVYVIIGDGPEREALEVACRISHVAYRMLGSVSDEELAAWYTLCDVFIMTPCAIGGDVEGFGLVYLEANAFGKPVIGTRSGGVEEAIVHRETGILVYEGDRDGIARAIRELFEDKNLREKLGAQGKKRVEHTFQWSEQIKLVS